MSIAAGQLNCRVVIAQPGVTKDAANQPIKTWTPKYTLWAQPMTVSGMSVVRSAQEGIPLVPGRYSWRIRYKPQGIDTSMRLEYQGMVFDIVDVRHDFANKEHSDLVCVLGVNYG